VPTASLSALNTWQTTLNFLISWSGNDHLTGVAHYDVQVKEGSGAWTDWLTGTTQSSSTFNGEDGKSYTFRVRAVDAAGNIGDWSNEVATTVDTTAPLASLEALQPLSFGAFQVTWSGSDATSGVASYDIEVQLDGGAWVNWISATTQTSALFTPTIGHTYSFRVRAVDHAGNAGGWSPVVSTQSGGKIFLPVVF
jgi:predicted phage tail protein